MRGGAGWKSGRRVGGSMELLHGKSRAQRGRDRRLGARRSSWPPGGAPAAACRGWSATEWLGYGGAGPCSGVELAGRLRLGSGGCGGRMRRRVPRGQIKGGTRDFGVRVSERSSAGISGRLREHEGTEEGDGTAQRAQVGRDGGVGPCAGKGIRGRRRSWAGRAGCWAERAGH